VSGRKWRENPVFERLQIWLLFDVLVTLTPFLFGFLQSIDQNKHFSFSAVLGTGQLLLVCVAISASALGELIIVDVPDKQRMLKSAAIGICFLVVIISALWFGDISASTVGNKAPDPKTISIGSMIVYLWTLSASAWCLTLATRREESRAATDIDTSAFTTLLRIMQRDEEK
jgi:hypothetical protein